MTELNIISQPPQQLLKAMEVARLLNVSRAFAYKLMQNGKLRTVSIAGARRVRPNDLSLFIEECLNPPANMNETGSRD